MTRAGITLGIATGLLGGVLMAAAQQQPDPVTLQRFLVEMQRARDERANEAVAARAEVARHTEEVAKLKAEIDRLNRTSPQEPSR